MIFSTPVKFTIVFASALIVGQPLFAQDKDDSISSTETAAPIIPAPIVAEPVVDEVAVLTPALPKLSDFQMCGTFTVGIESAICTCPPGFDAGAVWGSGPYTGDSNICTAAAHAGAITDQEYLVEVISRGAQDAYPSTESNGITTRSWGNYGSSFDVIFVPFEPEEVMETAEMSVAEDAVVDEGMTARMNDYPVCGTFSAGAESAICTCPPGFDAGVVWGSGPYTGDSNVCTAATHAGAITDREYLVEVIGRGAQDTYPGTESNGVTTRSWGSYGSSFDVTFVPLEPEEAADPAQIEVAEATNEASDTSEAMIEGGATDAESTMQVDGALVADNTMEAEEATDAVETAEMSVAEETDADAGMNSRLNDFPVCSSVSAGAESTMCTCPPGFDTGAVWGSGPYTSDSNICSAATHAGAITDQGYLVEVIGRGAHDAYSGSESNGITTHSWGSYGSSFDVIFVPLEPEEAMEPAQSEMAEEANEASETSETMIAEGTAEAENTMEAVETVDAVEAVETAEAVEAVETAEAVETVETVEAVEVVETVEAVEVVETADAVEAVETAEVVEAVETAEAVEAVETAETVEAEETADAAEAVEAAEAEEAVETAEAVEVVETMEAVEAVETAEAVETVDAVEADPVMVSMLPQCGTLPNDVETYTCSCDGDADTGIVWGSGPYTADSNICSAASHAGIIGVGGGEVTLIRLSGLEIYAASEMNQVQTHAWGSYTSSFTFNWN